MTPEFQNALTKLAQSLGTSVEYLWPILVKHERFNNILTAVFSVIVMLAAVWINRQGHRDNSWINRTHALVVSIIMGVFGVLLLLACLPDMLYPEAAVAYKLLHMR